MKNRRMRNTQYMMVVLKAPEQVYTNFCPQDDSGYIFNSLNIFFSCQNKKDLIVDATFEYETDDISLDRMLKYMSKDKNERINDMKKWQNYALKLVEACLGEADETFPNAFE